MTLNQGWGALNPPEPLPMGGKSMRDVGCIGLPSSGRQITKNPMNMLGGMGPSSNGNYSNGSSNFDRMMGFGERGSIGGERSGREIGRDLMSSLGRDSMSALGRDSMSAIGRDSLSALGRDSMSALGRDSMSALGRDSMSALGRDSMSALGRDSMSALGRDSMSGLGRDSMSSMGRDSMSSFGRDSLSSNLLQESNRDSLSSQLYGLGRDQNVRGGSSLGDRMGSSHDRMGNGGMSMLTKMNQQSSTNGSGYTTDGYGMGAMGKPQGQRSPPSTGFNGSSMGERSMSGSLSGMGYIDRGERGMGGLGEHGIGRMGEHGMGGGSRTMFRDLQEPREMRESREMREFLDMRERQNNRGMMGSRDMVRSNSEIGLERGMMNGMDRGMMGREMSSGDMMGRNLQSRDSRDYMRSNSDMMGIRDTNAMDRLERLEHLERLERMERMGSRMDMMDQQRDMPYPRDMMVQRSMSLSNGQAYGAGDNGYNRSISYQGGPPSPPQNDMKIGTWNDGNIAAANQGGSFPPVSNFEIGTFNINDPGSRSFGSGGNMYGPGANGTTQSNNGPIQPGMGIRETGIIEKLLHSYGFIQCCDRQARLFFHFSQFEGNIEHLKIGDPVEFEMTYDRRTGKPIASAVSKIAPEVVMSEERVIGTVTTEVKVSPEGGNETQGRISYENRGECFFLPFNTSDVEGNVTLASGDKVSFQMATVQRSGNLAAKTIRLENPAAPVKYQGVVNSLKDTYGYIERADVVKEIYFNIQDMQDGIQEDNTHIQLGDDVEFIIQTRNGKEVACQLTKLPPGTVVFEDVGTEYFRGQVLKPLDRAGKYQQTDPLPGRVKYRALDRSEEEIQFGEKDQQGDFTLRHGDWIKFIVATDRRDKLKRATKIEILDESFKVSDERREQGVIQSTKEGYLKCVDRSEKVYFNVSECLDVNRTLEVGDEVEFTSALDPTQPGRQLATRIKLLPQGTVNFDIIIAQNIQGLVAVEPAPVSSWSSMSPSKPGESPVKEGAGQVLYELNGLQLIIPLYAADCDGRNPPKVGDKVQFNINQLKSTKETNAVNLRILEHANVEVVNPVATPEPTEESPPREKRDPARLGSPQRGYVAALKDGFGFIETLQHDKEIFFHFSNVEGKAEKLEVGQEVEYAIYSREKGGKMSAEGVKPLSKGSIPKTPVKEELLYGKVVRPLRSVNPDQVNFLTTI